MHAMDGRDQAANHLRHRTKVCSGTLAPERRAATSAKLAQPVIEVSARPSPGKYRHPPDSDWRFVQ